MRSDLLPKHCGHENQAAKPHFVWQRVDDNAFHLGMSPLTKEVTLVLSARSLRATFASYP